jgi:hypothetical protein
VSRDDSLSNTSAPQPPSRWPAPQPLPLHRGVPIAADALLVSPTEVQLFGVSIKVTADDVHEYFGPFGAIVRIQFLALAEPTAQHSDCIVAFADVSAATAAVSAARQHAQAWLSRDAPVQHTHMPRPHA